jgi:hypothetical protein
VAIYGHGVKRKARIKDFITLEPVTVAPVKAAQIVRDDLCKNPAYCVDGRFVFTDNAIRFFWQSHLSIQSIQTASPGQVHNEAAQ